MALKRTLSFKRLRKTRTRNGSPRPTTQEKDTIRLFSYSDTSIHTTQHRNNVSGKFEYYANGERKSYYNPNGLLLRWYDDGKPWEECDYLHGKRNGWFTSWYPNGVCSQRSQWTDGKRNGFREMWDSNGRLVLKDYWVNGKRHKIYLNRLKNNGI